MTSEPPSGWPTTTGNDVVLVVHADCDAGYELVQELLASGRRVVVTARYAVSLSRILLGKSSADVMAIAADVDEQAQRARLMQRAADRFGHIAWVVDGRSGMLTHTTSVVESDAA
ncbi:SDR family NAD(P)-dependent oxidoreductase [Mycobacterium kyogaense]|uniref:SDR family NAD(P)-dependent oxidoreductase n=1 Tax=Mycobacterium kyogaense TaxID=2212479 RepID=UPI000DADA20C|nr:SDR family NAD(P)-dependent oxidoreductase [Mycobacterium kyogaense]